MSEPAAPPERKTTTVRLGATGGSASYGTDEATIDTAGALRLEATDVGPNTEELWGSDEHQFIVTVAADWKDSVLLLLLRERFGTVSAASTWLRERGIPMKASRWT
jgi:hypothetical protein